MSWHEYVGSESFNRIESAEPVEAVPVVDEQKLIGEVDLAQINNAILRHKNDAVTSRMCPADMENLNLLSSVIERQAIPERLIRQAGDSFLGRHFLPLH